MRLSIYKGVLLGGVLLLAAGSALAQATAAKAASVTADVAATVDLERGKVAGVPCGCFWMSGGGVDASVTFYHGWGVAANINGVNANNITQGLSLTKYAYLVGPRYTASFGRRRAHVFGEGLVGVSRGVNSVFPTATGTTDRANSETVQLGGGVDLPVTRGFGLRLIEADYLHTSFNNLEANQQNNLRLSFGVSYRFGN